MQGSRERVLREAEFIPGVIQYHLWGTVIILVCSVFLIPLLPIVVPLTVYYYRRHYQRLRVVLTNRDLKIHRGIWVREEKSIPLEKITDLRVFQGPVMRHFGVTGLAVETAGQTSAGALATVHGIVDTEAFRDHVLEQRDRIADAEDDGAGAVAAAGAAQPGNAEVLAMLGEIRDVLQRIENNTHKFN
ncbi:MAG: PH domain-containing protein [Wenzhouxiangella sp.]